MVAFWLEGLAHQKCISSFFTTPLKWVSLIQQVQQVNNHVQNFPPAALQRRAGNSVGPTSAKFTSYSGNFRRTAKGLVFKDGRRGKQLWNMYFVFNFVVWNYRRFISFDRTNYKDNESMSSDDVFFKKTVSIGLSCTLRFCARAHSSQCLDNPL